MKFEKSIVIDLGSNEFIKLGVSDCESFEDCDRELRKGARRISKSVNDKISLMIGKDELS